jgi:hypothetical protein
MPWGVQDSADDATEDAEARGHSRVLKGTRGAEPDEARLETVTGPIGRVSPRQIGAVSDTVSHTTRFLGSLDSDPAPLDDAQNEPRPCGSAKVQGYSGTLGGTDDSSSDDSVDFNFDGDVSVLEMLEQ